jgi:effector-binding domain-containing protein
MFTTPGVGDRPEQLYAGVRTEATMAELPSAIPQGLGEVFAWLGARGVAPAGPPFIRYFVVDMAGALDIALGVPVAGPLAGDGRVTVETLPAGRYASLVYTGVANGVAANGALLDWGAAQGLAWDRSPTARGDAFGARLESFLTNPDDEPDPAKWQTEVAIRLADRPPGRDA